MTKHPSFQKVVRRHAGETGQRYTEALTDLDGLDARMHHEPVAERLLAHLRNRYRIDATTATRLSVHNTYVGRPGVSARSSAGRRRGRRRYPAIPRATGLPR